MNQAQIRQQVLIVDDEPGVRTLLQRHLEQCGIECVTSHDALDALAKLNSGNFDLVISDMSMPGMSGLELLYQVQERSPETGFIMITGLRDINTAVNCMRMGACDFITKPFDLLAIRRAVERAFERRR